VREAANGMESVTLGSPTTPSSPGNSNNLEWLTRSATTPTHKINKGKLHQCGHTASRVTDQAPSGTDLIVPNDFVDSGKGSLEKEKLKRV